ncbi:MAG: flagellar hook-associated protein FlgL [Candidatus Muiribacteriota bacterium]
MRITNAMMSNRVLYNIQNSLSKMDKYSQMLSTGKKFVLSQDDPINTTLGMHFRTKVTESEQFIRNIDDGLSWLDTTDRALGHSVDLFRRVRDVTLQGVNDTLEQSDRDALAKEIDQLLNGILDTANTEFKGNFVFSGSDTRTPPFQEFHGQDSGESANVTTHDHRNPDHEDRHGVNMNSITRIKYNGNSNEIQRQLQQTLSITINDTGNNIFMADTHSVKGGSLAVSNQNVPLNDAQNFDGEIQVPETPPPPFPSVTDNETSFSVGVKDGKMATISYDADKDSILDIADKVNEKASGMSARVEKTVIDNADFYQLVFEADESGKEIEFFDSDKSTIKKTSEAIAITPGFDPATDGFNDILDSGEDITGEVIINGKQFVLDDYDTVRQFMNSVVNDEDAGVSEFAYDEVNEVFKIKAEEGGFLDLKEKGDVSGPDPLGFFSGLGINTNGNILEKFNMFNKVEGTETTAARDETLNSIEDFESGQFIVNGAVIEVDKEADSLESIATKINRADSGVRASVEEDINPPGNFRLILRSLHAGEMQLEDREGDILQNLGFVDKFDGEYNNYPDSIKDPDDIGIFRTIMDVRDNLYRGDNEALQKNLGEIDKITDNILQYRSKTGARVHAAEISQSKLDDVRINTTHMLSNVEDVDIAEVIMKMKMQENVQTAALQTGASIIQRSLVDFLR